MNATNVDALRAVGTAKADTAVLALGEEDLEASILATAAVSDLGVGRIIVRAANELQERILSRVGATQVIFPEKQMGEQLAKSILMSGVLDQVTLATGQTVARVRLRRDLAGKTLADANLRARYQVIVIGIQRPRRSVDDRGEIHEDLDLQSIPGPDEVLGEDDIMIVVGSQKQIELLARKD
jgi:trk system potassium uptake protein TrkA